MNLQAEKLEVMRMILDTNNPGLIHAIKALFKKQGDVDFWNDLSQLQKDDILSGIQEVENGDVVDYDEFAMNVR
jgi:hypothetical protein